MTKFNVGDKVVLVDYKNQGTWLNKNRYLEKGMTGKIVALAVIRGKRTVRISWEDPIAGYSDYPYNNCWSVNEEDIDLVDNKCSLEQKVKTMWERQPYVKRLKQCSDKANSLSGMS